MQRSLPVSYDLLSVPSFGTDMFSLISSFLNRWSDRLGKDVHHGKLA